LDIAAGRRWNNGARIFWLASHIGCWNEKLELRLEDSLCVIQVVRYRSYGARWYKNPDLFARRIFSRKLEYWWKMYIKKSVKDTQKSSAIIEENVYGVPTVI
jgi:hypothetical protein